jgi:dTDP-glucose 4,6-dehydratase
MNAMNDKPLPVYGDGMNIRDWIYVLDNCKGIDVVLNKGKIGEVYNVGGGNEKPNIEITKLILELLEKPESLIKYVDDRLGHDRRYSLDSTKTQKLGWKPEWTFKEAMQETINWYMDNKSFINNIN